jgi:Alkylmercury lyase
MSTEVELRSVREAIYESIVKRGVAPSTHDIADTCAIPEPRVRGIVRELADAHVIVLRPGSTDLWAAPPFSAVTSGFMVRAREGSWFAPCAWDAFGIPAALQADAEIEAACAETGEPIPCGVRGGRESGTAVIHLLVPAAHFWDDIIYT